MEIRIKRCRISLAQIIVFISAISMFLFLANRRIPVYTEVDVNDFEVMELK